MLSSRHPRRNILTLAVSFATMSLRSFNLRFVVCALAVAFIVSSIVATRLAAVPVVNSGLALNFPTLLFFPLVTMPFLPGLLVP